MHSRFSERILQTAGLFAALLLGLRIYTFLAGFDADGLLPRGSLLLPVTVVLCVLCFAVLAGLGLRLNRLPGAEDCFLRSGVWSFLQILGAVLLLLGCLFSLLLQKEALTPVWRVNHIVGLIAAVAMLTVSFGSGASGSGIFWLRLPAALYALFSMILRFQAWSHDPLVIEIIPFLLAFLCCMVSLMLLCGFPLKVGHRRSTVCFGLCAGIFALMGLPDVFLGRRAAAGDVLILLGLALWCVVHALQLLRDAVQEETAPAETAEEAQNPPEPPAAAENEPTA